MSEASQSILTKDTLIPIGAVIIVLSAAFSYGIMYNKVETLGDEVAALRDDIKELTKAVGQLEGNRSVSYAGE
jgi:hypothetical protein